MHIDEKDPLLESGTSGRGRTPGWRGIVLMPNSIGAGFRIVVAIVLTSWSGSGPSEVSAGDDQGMSPALRCEGIRWPGEGSKKIRPSYLT
jgi:hypothetical protein